mmetsp:Transcript_5377/g.14553  ORF Transcript_5377/g.14553 Transcript_5377/m.14553 type:complete len:220 (+) Transcript_5377:151-810(+)
MSTASRVASLRAPTAPFSRKSWTVAFSSCLMEAITDTAMPPPSACGRSHPGGRTSTSRGSGSPGTATRARGGSDTPSMSTTFASTTRPSGNSSGHVVPRAGTPSARRIVSPPSSSSPMRSRAPSRRREPPVFAKSTPLFARSTVSSAASRNAPTTPFSRNSSTVPCTSALTRFHRAAMPSGAGGGGLVNSSQGARRLRGAARARGALADKNAPPLLACA